MVKIYLSYLYIFLTKYYWEFNLVMVTYFILILYVFKVYKIKKFRILIKCLGFKNMGRGNEKETGWRGEKTKIPCSAYLFVVFSTSDFVWFGFGCCCFGIEACVCLYCCSAAVDRVKAMERIIGAKYKLGRKIGSGSFGEIYLGFSLTRFLITNLVS